MPRYFFHVHDGEESLDLEGIELASPEAAHEEAVVTSGRIIADHGGNLGDEEWRMWVTDETGTTICEMKFSAHC